jgi:hypothetical protein
MVARGRGALPALVVAIFAAPFVAVWGLITLARDRQWTEVYTGILAIAVPAATIWWIYRRASEFSDANRQVAIGSVALIAGYFYLFYACYAFWGVKSRLRFVATGRSRGRQTPPRTTSEGRAAIRRNATVMLALSGVLLTAAARFGDFLYRSELGWAEILMYWMGLWLLLRGFYGVVLLGYLPLTKVTSYNARVSRCGLTNV